MLNPETSARWRAARPFAWTGVAAIIAGGLVAAAVAHRPMQRWVWMSAYLVLIVGAAQIVFGAGQAWLSEHAPPLGWVAGEWAVFNIGSAGVVAGTWTGSSGLVMAGTALFALGIALFLLGTRGTGSGWQLGYRVLLGLVFLSSLVGLALSLHAH